MGEIEDQTKARVQARRNTGKEELPQTIIQPRGDFLMIAQGDQVVLLTKKEVFGKLEVIREFAK